MDSKDECTTALQNDCSKDPVGVVLMKDFSWTLAMFSGFQSVTSDIIVLEPSLKA